jgi:hypothetical protein
MAAVGSYNEARPKDELLPGRSSSPDTDNAVSVSHE